MRPLPILCVIALPSQIIWSPSAGLEKKQSVTIYPFLAGRPLPLSTRSPLGRRDAAAQAISRRRSRFSKCLELGFPIFDGVFLRRCLVDDRSRLVLGVGSIRFRRGRVNTNHEPKLCMSYSSTPRTGYRFPVHDLQVVQVRCIHDLCDLYHVAAWEPYNLYGRRTGFLAWICSVQILRIIS